MSTTEEILRPTNLMRVYQGNHGVLEHLANQRLPETAWPVIRLDGRSFHTLTKGLEKPFDAQFERAMNRGAKALMREFDAEIAYVQSDEVTLVLQQDCDLFDRRIEKLLSVSASVMTAAFVESIGSLALGLYPSFDARLLFPASWEWVVALLMERQVDCVKNCLSAVAHWHLIDHCDHTARTAHKFLLGMTLDDRIEFLMRVGVYGAITVEHRYGRTFVWEDYVKMGWNPLLGKEVPAMRRRLSQQAAIFTDNFSVPVRTA